MSKELLDPAALRVTDAVIYVMGRRRELGGEYIWPAFRELAGEHRGVDPFAAQVEVEAGLHTGLPTPTTESEWRARASLHGALLHCWFKVPNELRTLVYREIRENAVRRGDDPDQGQWEAQAVLDSARNDVDAAKDAYERLQRETAQRDAKRRQGELNAMKARLKVV